VCMWIFAYIMWQSLCFIFALFSARPTRARFFQPENSIPGGWVVYIEVYYACRLRCVVLCMRTSTATTRPRSSRAVGGLLGHTVSAITVSNFLVFAFCLFASAQLGFFAACFSFAPRLFEGSVILQRLMYCSIIWPSPLKHRSHLTQQIKSLHRMLTLFLVSSDKLLIFSSYDCLPMLHGISKLKSARPEWNYGNCWRPEGQVFSISTVGCGRLW
jgi:hypothetical protein